MELISEALKVNLKKELDDSKLKPKPNNRNVARNRSIVRNYLSCLEESGSISKVNFKPLIVSPLNLVPKSNGAPRLIQDLSRFNKFVSRGPKVKHFNVLTYLRIFLMTRILLSQTYETDIFIFPIFHRIGRILDSVLRGSIFFSMFFVLVSLLSPFIFRIL